MILSLLLLLKLRLVHKSALLLLGRDVFSPSDDDEVCWYKDGNLNTNPSGFELLKDIELWDEEEEDGFVSHKQSNSEVEDTDKLVEL